LKFHEWTVTLKTPSRTNEVLLGDWWAHFEGMLHEETSGIEVEQMEGKSNELE
jgi:hypothetical protein